MADLRTLLEDLGFASVRTLLNSGNAIFTATGTSPTKIASSLEAAIEEKFGFTAAVIVVTAGELERIIAENPLAEAAHDPSRFLVAFVAKPAPLKAAGTLLATVWKPEALAIGGKVAYLWCAGGILESRLLPEFSRATANAATTRNWSTVLKLQQAIVG